VEAFLRTDSRLLRLVVIAVVMACAWFGYLGVISGEAVSIALTLVLWIPLAVGLWLFMPWARYLCLFVLLNAVWASPLWELSGWIVVDDTPDPLPVREQFVFGFAPLFILSAFFAEVLFAYGREFRWPLVPREVVAQSFYSPPLPRSWPLWCFAVIAIPAAIVESLAVATDIAGGCLANPLAASQNANIVVRVLWSNAPWGCIVLGLLAFLLSSPSGERLWTKVFRVLIYGVTMYELYEGAGRYIELTHFCYVQLH